MWVNIFFVLWCNSAVRSWTFVTQLRHCSIELVFNVENIRNDRFCSVHAPAYRRASWLWNNEQQFGRVPLLPATSEACAVCQSRWFSAIGVFRATVGFWRRFLQPFLWGRVASSSFGVVGCFVEYFACVCCVMFIRFWLWPLVSDVTLFVLGH